MNTKKVYIRPWFWQEIENTDKKYAHIIMIATKPDIIKQAPLYLELKSRWELVVLVHTGQHYDYNLSEWVLKEFWMKVDVNLNIYWSIHKKFSLIVERLGDFLVKLNEEFKKIPIPYVHGDTLTAATADKAAFLNKFAVVHVEAWIRTFTPKKDFFEKVFQDYEEWKLDLNWYYKQLQNKENFELGNIEPYPEQFDTRSIEWSTWFFAVPVENYKQTLLNEWFDSNKIKVVWNTVVDAIAESKKKIKQSKAFEIYQNMKWKDFIFVTIHRRENCEKKERFLVLYNALKKLIQQWVNVCWLELYASWYAIDKYGLRDDLNNLIKNYPENFAYWKALAHHHEVIDMITKAKAVVTDSWSMQEEANIVWTTCVTLRFGSDRIETIWAWYNLIAPPINSNLVVDIVWYAMENIDKKSIKNLYWENVSKKIVDEVSKMLEKQWQLFQFDDERLWLDKYFNWRV